MDADVTAIDEIYALAIDYDPRATRDTRWERQDAFAAWLLQDPQRWRLAPPDPAFRAAKSVAQVLVGEEGAGKSTYLDLLRERLEASPSNLVVMIDFTSISGPDEEVSYLKHIRAQIERRVRQESALFMEYRTLLRRLQLETSFYMCLPIQDRYRGLIETIPVETLLTDQSIALALSTFERNEGYLAAQLAITAIQQLANVRVFLLIDNVDKHGKSRVRAIARAFSQRLIADTVAVIAVRPYHTVTAQRAFEEIRDVPILDLTQDTNQVFAIASLRVRSAREYLQSIGKVQQDDDLRFSSRILDALNRIGLDDDSRHIVAQWHNFNIRRILPFLVRASIRMIGSSVDAPSPLGVVYAELMETAMPKEAKEIYTPNFPPVRGRHPFVFLWLRILSYLYKRKDLAQAPLLDDVVSDFCETFGLADRDVREAIMNMGVRDGHQVEDDDLVGALVRVQDVDRDKDVKGVVLMPAGRSMLELIITSCAFLEWNYNRAPKTTVGWVDSANKAAAQVRLDRAVAFVGGRVLPLFLREHPYMGDPEFAMSNGKRDREVYGRLTEYRRMFGYTTGHWFIGELMESLHGYAARRPHLDDGELRALMARMDGYLRNLDQVATGYPA